MNMPEIIPLWILRFIWLPLIVFGFIRLDLGGIPIYSFQMTLESILLAGLLASFMMIFSRILRFLMALLIVFFLIVIKAYAKFYADYASLDDLIATGLSAGEGLRSLPFMHWRSSEIFGGLAFLVGCFLMPKSRLRISMAAASFMFMIIIVYNLMGLSIVKGSPYAIHAPAFSFFMGKREKPVISVSDRNKFRPVDYLGLGYDRVVVVVMESVRTDLAYSGIMPNLLRLKRLGHGFENFANTTQTIRSEISIYCSGLDNIYGYTYAQRALAPRDCLPAVLRQAGWETAYFHGNTDEFFNRVRFLPLIGFNTLCFDKCLMAKGNANMIGWGVSDITTVREALAHVDTAPRPLMTAVMTLTNHFPFHDHLPVMDEEHERIRTQLDVSDPLFKYKMGHLYTDYALGQVLSFAKRMDNKTLLVLTGDHGLYEFSPKASEATRQYNYMRVPLVVVGSKLSPRKDISSHLDIAPTILMHVGGKMNALGNNLLGHKKESTERLIPLAKMGYPGFVNNEAYCFSSPAGSTINSAYQRDRFRFLHPEQSCQCITHRERKLTRVDCDHRFEAVLGLHEFFSEEVNR